MPNILLLRLPLFVFLTGSAGCSGFALAAFGLSFVVMSSSLQYNCDTATTCKRMGPYFAGMSTEACNAHGGTWCPQPMDCTTLSNCIKEGIDRHGDEHPAYQRFLQTAPKLANPLDSTQCGR